MGQDRAVFGESLRKKIPAQAQGVLLAAVFSSVFCFGGKGKLRAREIYFTPLAFYQINVLVFLAFLGTQQFK